MELVAGGREVVWWEGRKFPLPPTLHYFHLGQVWIREDLLKRAMSKPRTAGKQPEFPSPEILKTPGFLV